jgi:hypothetical protein
MKNILRSKSQNTLKKTYSTNNIIYIFDKIEEEENKEKENFNDEDQEKYILNVSKISNYK